MSKGEIWPVIFLEPRRERAPAWLKCRMVRGKEIKTRPKWNDEKEMRQSKGGANYHLTVAPTQVEEVVSTSEESRKRRRGRRRKK